MRSSPSKFGSTLFLAMALQACSGSNEPAGSGNEIGSGGSSGMEASGSGGGFGGADPITTGYDHRGGANQTPSGGKGAAGAGAGNVPVAIPCRVDGDGKTTLSFINGCSKAVTFRGSDITGGTLAPSAFACVDIGSASETLSSKRYWGWVGTDPGSGRHTLAEFTFNTDFYDLDWYDISHVDAHNLPMAILPFGRPKCRQLRCPEDFLALCPSVGQYENEEGDRVSCVNPNRDDPSNPVSLLFERCDDAYAWSGDDQNGTDESPMVGCEVEDFDVVFCPGSP